MLLFGSLLTVCDGTFWPLVTDVYNESVAYGTNYGRYSWGVRVRFCAGELIFCCANCLDPSVHRS